MLPSKDELASIGRISRLHGFKGDMTVMVTLERPHKLAKPATIYLEQNGSITPYTVLEFAMKTAQSAKLTLQGINSEEAAKLLVNHDVLIPAEDLPEEEQFTSSLKVLNGYAVVDELLGNVGTVEDIIELPGNTLLKIVRDKKEALIPVNEHFIQKIDRRKKMVMVSLPEGLLDL